MPARFPLAYWGSVSWYRSLLKAGEDAVIEVHETYRKQSLRNRCTILASEGIQHLSVPVTKPEGSKSQTHQIGIDYKQPWALMHWRAIQTAYASAPYFEHYGPLVKELLEKRFDTLLDLDMEIHHKVILWLELPLKSCLTQQFHKSYDSDFLNDFEERKSDLKWYQQVFADRSTFQSDLSVLDLLMNEGPMARNWLF